MRIILIVIIIICMNSVFAEPQKIDSVYNEKLTALQDSLNNLNQRHDVIQKEFEKVNYQKSYFDLMINALINIYTIIITILVAIAGLYNWKKSKKIKRDLIEIKKYNKQSELRIKHLLKLESDILETTAQMKLIYFKDFSRNKNFWHAIEFALESLVSYDRLGHTTPQQILENEIHNCIMQLPNINSQDKIKVEMLLNELSVSKDAQTREFARRLMKNYFSKINEIEMVK